MKKNKKKAAEKKTAKNPMLKRELFDLLAGFEAVGSLRGVKFAYAVAKNRDCVMREVRPLQQSIEPSKEIAEYEEERVKLCLVHCQKDEGGKPLIQNGVYVGVNGNPEFEKALEELKEKFQEALDKQEKDKAEYDRLLDEEVEIEFHLLQFVDVPKEITAAQMISIFPIMAAE